LAIARVALGLAAPHQQVAELRIRRSGPPAEEIERDLGPTPRLVGSELLECLVAGEDGVPKRLIGVRVAGRGPMASELCDRPPALVESCLDRDRDPTV